MKAPFTEWLTFEVPQLTADKATVVLRWENVGVPFTVETGTTSKTMGAARAAVSSAAADDWRTPLRAANYAFDNGNLADAQTWSDQAVKSNANIQTLYLQARLFAKQGKKADAIRTGEVAISKAGPKDTELAGEIRTDVDSWKK